MVKLPSAHQHYWSLCVQVQQSLDLIDAACASEGPFDGLFAFSQGASLAALVMALGELRSKEVDISATVPISIGPHTIFRCVLVYLMRQDLSLSLCSFSLFSLPFCLNRSYEYFSGSSCARQFYKVLTWHSKLPSVFYRFAAMVAGFLPGEGRTRWAEPLMMSKVCMRAVPLNKEISQTTVLVRSLCSLIMFYLVSTWSVSAMCISRV